MMCDECRERPATVHVTKIINGNKTEMNLCERCAKEKGESLGLFYQPKFSLQSLLGSLLAQDPSYGVEVGLTQWPEHRCPNCGLDYSTFTRSGFLGCSDCYVHFRDRLNPLFKRVHGSGEHHGKVPKRTGGVHAVRRELEDLRIELQQCVRREEYEKAAEIRDRIKELEKRFDELKKDRE